jgi:hypothetical protein
MPNFPLLDATLAYTREHQDSWDQSVWALPRFDRDRNVCGTACCFAANALIVSGYRIEWGEWEGGENYVKCVILGPDGEPVEAPRRHRTAANDADIGYIAQDLLSLTDDQSDELFASDNYLIDLEEMIKGWRAE